MVYPLTPSVNKKCHIRTLVGIDIAEEFSDFEKKLNQNSGSTAHTVLTFVIIPDRSVTIVMSQQCDLVVSLWMDRLVRKIYKLQIVNKETLQLFQ